MSYRAKIFFVGCCLLSAICCARQIDMTEKGDAETATGSKVLKKNFQRNVSIDSKLKSSEHKLPLQQPAVSKIKIASSSISSAQQADSNNEGNDNYEVDDENKNFDIVPLRSEDEKRPFAPGARYPRMYMPVASSTIKKPYQVTPISRKKLQELFPSLAQKDNANKKYLLPSMLMQE